MTAQSQPLATLPRGPAGETTVGGSPYWTLIGPVSSVSCVYSWHWVNASAGVEAQPGRGDVSTRIPGEPLRLALRMPDTILRQQLERHGCDGWRAVSRIAHAVAMSPTAVSVGLTQDGHAHKDEHGVPRPAAKFLGRSC